MRHLYFTLVLSGVWVLPTRAGDAPPARKPIMEIWDAVFVGDGRAGHVRTLFEEFTQDGAKRIAGTVQMRLSVKRFDDVLQLGMDSGTIETPQGNVVGTLMRQFLGKNKQLEITGTVKDGKLHLVQDGKIELKPAPWNDEVVGLYRQYVMYQERKAKAKDTFTYLSFEPTISQVLRQEALVKGIEDVDLFGTRKKLVRVEVKPQRVEKVQLPTQVMWLQDDLTTLCSQTRIEGLGTLTLYRTTKEYALAPGAVVNLTDVGLGQLVRLKQRMLRPLETKQVTYRVTVRDDPDPASTFAKYDRQEIRNVKDNTFELHVWGGERESKEKAPGDEFSQSSYFINSDDKVVQELTQKAVGEEKAPWKKALLIEKWVNDNMKFGSHELLATADHAARTLEGDCSEAAMLTAAMCRVEKIPSRVAVGLIYADIKGPALSFHMWTEVWVDGRWKALDATLGQGGIAADHLKIADHSWHEIRNMTPVFPVLRVLGKIGVDIVREEY